MNAEQGHKVHVTDHSLENSMITGETLKEPRNEEETPVNLIQTPEWSLGKKDFFERS